MLRTIVRTCICSLLISCSLQALAKQGSTTTAAAQLGSAKSSLPRLRRKSHPPITHGTVSREMVRAMAADNNDTDKLPLWNYQVIAPRSGSIYEGMIVGRDPSKRGRQANVHIPTQLVPVVLRFHTVITGFDPSTGVTTTSGDMTFDPSVADTSCLAAPNTVPIKLVKQSPILRNADFNFGGTDMGTTQYVDAFQRANFWNVIDQDNYHVRLAPLKVLDPLVIDVPAANGMVLPADLPLFGSFCGPVGFVDINVLDAGIVNALDALSLSGVNPGTLPILIIYNSNITIGPNDPFLSNCCFGGYHGVNPTGPLTFQTYAVAEYDTLADFGVDEDDTYLLSHEVAEWMNDPFIVNRTPAWGHVGQVNGCQTNLEVGDPLIFSPVPSVVMNNGYTYHLEELAFFSWFYGGPSLGTNGWYSNNASFLTDAGPVCH
jgi:hypothetical protein